MDKNHISIETSSGPKKTTAEVLANLWEEIENLPGGWSSVARFLGMSEEEAREWMKNEPPVSMDDVHRVAAVVFWVRIQDPESGYQVLGLNGIGDTHFSAHRVPSVAEIDAIVDSREFKAWMARLYTK